METPDATLSFVSTRGGRGFAALVAGVLCVGCTHTPDRVVPPVINPTEAGEAAIKMYDKNGDGAISGDELKQSPPLKAALKRLDAGGGKITAQSIAARIQQWQDSKIGLMALTVIVRLDGKPVMGATVTAEPEKFLGPELTTISGTTIAGGATPLSSGKDQFGAKPGFYRLRISKLDNGKELFPARYNTATELGFELAQDNTDVPAGRLKLDLTSR